MAIDDVTVDYQSCEYNPCSEYVTWCMNGGTCTDVTSSSGQQGEYICECAAGWHGSRCQLDVDECTSNPCQNGATCTHGIDSYSCICDIGYHGTDCEFVNECLSPEVQRCENGGTCVPVKNDATCVCQNGYLGDFCEINFDECDPSPCLYGKCTDGIDSFTCTCDTDWSGALCSDFKGSCDFDYGLDVCQYTSASYPYFQWTVESGPTPNLGTGPDTDHTSTETIIQSEETDGFWGDWGPEERCPDGQFVYGYRLQTEPINGDNSALNTIDLQCARPGSTSYTTISSSRGFWGVYSDYIYCNGENNEVVGFQMMIQSNQGSGDDTAANKLDLFCKSGQKLSAPTETSFGDWVPHLRCPHGQSVIGLQVRMEAKQGDGDDTALNGVRMICSSYTEGSYIYANAEYKGSGDRAVIYTPFLGSDAVGTCTTINFWYWMVGDTTGTLNLHITNDMSRPTSELEPIWSRSGDQGQEGWLQAEVNISSSTLYMAVFEVIPKDYILPPYRGDIAVDDVVIVPDNCVFNLQQCTSSPCQNGGTCVEKGQDGYDCLCVGDWEGKNCENDADLCVSNPCGAFGTCIDNFQSYVCACDEQHVGKHCQYWKGSCDFETGKDSTCLYDNSGNGDDNYPWTRQSGKTPSARTGPSFDHTTGTDGYYMYAEATDREIGDYSEIRSPYIPGSANTCTHLSFWYYMYGDDIGDLSVLLEFDNIIPSTPTWLKVGGDDDGDWKNVQINISASADFRIVFRVNFLSVKDTSLPGVDLDNLGDVALDDVVVNVDTACAYDSCFIAPCRNGATCVAENDGKFQCICADGYGGPTCEIPDVCQPNPCMNNGICSIDEVGAVQCLCSSVSWVGDRCDKPNFCIPDPCIVGNCTNTDGGYACECEPGYGGTLCDIDINECQSNPCLHGGQCTDDVNGYRCNCSPGFTGASCQYVDGTCDFDIPSFCNWTSDSASDFEWILGTGPSTDFPVSGPPSDHTIGSKDEGSYTITMLYLDEPKPDSVYRLRSPEINIQKHGYNFNLELFYHMKGTGMGAFSVYLEELSKNPKMLFQIEGSQRDGWEQLQINFVVSNNARLVLEHKTVFTLTFLGDLAVDDIKITPLDFVVPTTTAEVTTTSSSPVGTTTETRTTTTSSKVHSTVTTPSSVTFTTTSEESQQSTTITDEENSNSGLSNGSIAGIAVGAALAVLISITTFFLVIRMKRSVSSDSLSHDNDSKTNNQSSDATRQGVVNPLSSLSDEFNA